MAWIFGDSKGLDISARSKIRMEKHKDALDTYAIAESHGLRLRDHFVNKCRCQISLGRLVDAFETAQMIDPLQQYDPLPSISKSLRGYKQAERRDIVLDMMAIADVPEEITTHLSQWSKEAVARRHAKRSLVEADSSEEVDTEVAPLEPDSDTDDAGAESTSQEKSINSSAIMKESAEYVLGSILVDAYRKPSRIPSLPFRILREGLRLRSERLPNEDLIHLNPLSPSSDTSLRIAYSSFLRMASDSVILQGAILSPKESGGKIPMLSWYS